VHPANEPVLRYFSPQIEWELLGLSEHWRRELKIVFRKRSGDGNQAAGNSHGRSPAGAPRLSSRSERARRID